MATSGNTHLVVIGGPNGAGKSTMAPSLLRGTLEVDEFVNTDLIAQGLSVFRPEMTAFQAGRIMLSRLHYLAQKRVDFAFETTLSSKSFAPWITELKKEGYDFGLIFLFLSNEDLAVARVADRVRMGGHNVLEETVRRRYHAGISNFFNLYRPLADTWFFYDNSGSSPLLIAYGEHEHELLVNDLSIWHNLKENYGTKRKT